MATIVVAGRRRLAGAGAGAAGAVAEVFASFSEEPSETRVTPSICRRRTITRETSA